MDAQKLIESAERMPTPMPALEIVQRLNAGEIALEDYLQEIRYVWALDFKRCETCGVFIHRKKSYCSRRCQVSSTRQRHINSYGWPYRFKPTHGERLLSVVRHKKRLSIA